VTSSRDPSVQEGARSLSDAWEDLPGGGSGKLPKLDIQDTERWWSFRPASDEAQLGPRLGQTVLSSFTVFIGNDLGGSLIVPDQATSIVGLSTAEARSRLAELGPNAVVAQHRVRLIRRIGNQLRDPLILLLLAAVILTVVVGDLTDAAVIALVIVVNTAVGVIQEVRADHAVTALASLSAPRARVIRDGRQQEIAAADVVPGDALVLAEGDLVAADAEVVESAALLVDESSVTGESVPVEKALSSADYPANDHLAAGSVVVRGRGVATVTACAA
jgi:magnesium-transporting ATPase (P-type)